MTLFRPYPSYVASFMSKVRVFFCHFGIVVDFENFEKKLEPSGG
jgi:hypothetical protein